MFEAHLTSEVSSNRLEMNLIRAVTGVLETAILGASFLGALPRWFSVFGGFSGSSSLETYSMASSLPCNPNSA